MPGSSVKHHIVLGAFLVSAVIIGAVIMLESHEFARAQTTTSKLSVPDTRPANGSAKAVADLTVSNLQVKKFSAKASQATFTVRNKGKARVTTTYEVSIRRTSGVVKIVRSKNISLKKNAAFVAKVRLAAPLETIAEVKVVVDPGNKIFETNENNNRLAVTLAKSQVLKQPILKQAIGESGKNSGQLATGSGSSGTTAKKTSSAGATANTGVATALTTPAVAVTTGLTGGAVGAAPAPKAPAPVVTTTTAPAPQPKVLPAPVPVSDGPVSDPDLPPPAEVNSRWTQNANFGYTAPISYSKLNNGQDSWSYYASGNNILAVDNRSGEPKWTNPGTTRPVDKLVIFKPSFGSDERLVFSGEDGDLYSFGALLANDRKFVLNTKRDSCADDSLGSAPIIQQFQSSANFFELLTLNGHANDDVMFAITRNGCEDTAQNQVVAYYVSSGESLWRFNNDGSYAVGAGAGCTLDAKRDVLYCATNLPDNRYQNTLWAISTIDGALIWAINAGDLKTSPTLYEGRIYTANSNGAVNVFDATTGAQLWGKEVAFNAGFSRPLWVGAVDGIDATVILATDDNGGLHRIDDLGTKGWLVWTAGLPGNNEVTTQPVVAPYLGKVYVGTANGAIHQINLQTSDSEARATMGDNNAVLALTADIDGAKVDINRLVARTGAKVRYFAIPWLAGQVGDR